MLPLSEGTELNGKEDEGLYYWEILGFLVETWKDFEIVANMSGERGSGNEGDM